jgi:CO/xanthine dehydrogenase FAD-binding subunit
MAKPTNYYRPKTLTEAIALAAQSGAIPLAGGALTLGGDTPETLIDVQDVPELRQVEVNDSGATFGAAVPLQALLDWPALPDALRRALTRAVPLNLRDNISVGESLHQWKTPLLSEWIAALLAHDAGVELVNDDAERTWDNIIGLMAAGRLDTEFITALNIPALREDEALGASFVARSPADVPIVCASAYLTVDATNRVRSAFVFVGGASAQPFTQVRLPLIERPLDEANIASAAKAVAPQVDPPDDYLGSAEYRREMARVTVQRALMDCMERLS